MWLKPNTIANVDCIFVNGENGFTNTSLIIRFNASDQIALYYPTGAAWGTEMNSATGFGTGSWKCLVITTNGTNAIFYYDGSQDDSDSQSQNLTNKTTYDWTIGTRESDADRFYDGDMAHLAVVTGTAIPAANVGGIGRGVNPFVHLPTIAYFPLDGNNSPENNYAQPTYTGTLTNTTKATTNPPVELIENYL